MPPFSPGNRVIVLGAGATRASNFENFEPECKPPLNSDFFTQLQRIRSKYKDLIKDVIRDVVSLFGPNFDLTLEDYFTQLEFLVEAAKMSPKAKDGLSTSDLREKLDRLRAALAATLEISTDVAIRKSQGCTRHKKFVENLRPRDVLITLNYDCVMDHALRKHGDRKWNARYGYGFREPSRIIGIDHWDPETPSASQNNTVHLLKLHGSLNWQLPDSGIGEIVLKQRLHQQNGIPRFSVIPPVWNKRFGASLDFKDLWRKAELAIRNAKEIGIVGFSFTPTDLHVESLFRLALARSQLQTLVIVNPSRNDRQRIRHVFSKPLSNGVIVRQYKDFERFVDCFPACFS